MQSSMASLVSPDRAASVTSGAVRRFPPGFQPAPGLSGPGLLRVRVRSTASGWAPCEVEIIPQRLRWSIGR